MKKNRVTVIVASQSVPSQERESFLFFQSFPQHERESFSYLSSPCPHCGSTTTRIGAGRKPQEASLHCGDCKRFIRWVSASELNRLAKGGEA